MPQPSSFHGSVLASRPGWGQRFSTRRGGDAAGFALAGTRGGREQLLPSRTSLTLRFTVGTKTPPEPSSPFQGMKTPPCLQPAPHGSSLSALAFHSQAAAGTSRGTSPSWDLISALERYAWRCLPSHCFYAVQTFSYRSPQSSARGVPMSGTVKPRSCWSPGSGPVGTSSCIPSYPAGQEPNLPGCTLSPTVLGYHKGNQGKSSAPGPSAGCSAEMRTLLGSISPAGSDLAQPHGCPRKLHGEPCLRRAKIHIRAGRPC